MCAIWLRAVVMVVAVIAVAAAARRSAQLRWAAVVQRHEGETALRATVAVAMAVYLSVLAISAVAPQPASSELAQAGVCA